MFGREGPVPHYMSWTYTEILVWKRPSCCLKFFSLRNLARHCTPWTSKEILAMQKLYYWFGVFFLLEILLRTLDVSLLKESCLVLRFPKMSSKLLECFSFVWFCMLCLENILKKVLEHFSNLSSLLWYKFLHFLNVNVPLDLTCLRLNLNSDLKFSGNFFVLI